ncbi:unnamed protein product [Linum trigynum]|uniref:Uncharacterized protein n=1 Tax=Linum trigynum TaxID=586398 RepID=A0AAV2DPA7_9ROSI
MADEIVLKLSGMDLTEDEEALISIDESVTSEGVEEAIKELGVAGKIVTGKFPSEKILKRILSEAWKLKKEFDVQVMRSNILRIQLYCVEDKNKILHGGEKKGEKKLEKSPQDGETTLCVYEDLSRELKGASVRDREGNDQNQWGDREEEQGKETQISEQVTTKEEEDRRVVVKQLRMEDISQLKPLMSQKEDERRKWKRVVRKKSPNDEQNQSQGSTGKRGAPEAMDVDVVSCVEKRPKGNTITSVDGDVADLADEQGRRAQ